jgi:hypothetical protein
MINKTKISPNNDKRRVANSDSFLEALRDLGGGFVDSAAGLPGGIAQEAFNQLTGNKRGELKPNQALDLDQIRSKENQIENQAIGFQQDYLDIRKQEKLIWTRQQQETELQIKALIIELKKLAQVTTSLAKEVKIASEQLPVESGSYHLTFFEKLRQSILLFKQHIEQAASWLQTSNQKAQKRNFYWGQVRKSGTKFMLSQERYMATQAG